MAQKINVTVGERIAQLRGKRTQGEVATALHISREKISAWEQGRRMLKLPDIHKVASYFGVSVDYLLFGVQPDQMEIHQELGLSHEAIEALKRFKKADGVTGSEDRAIGKCEALSKALACPAFLQLVSTLMLLRSKEPGHFDGMMPDEAGEFYEGMLSPDTYAAALAHRLVLTIESLRKGEGGGVPEYAPWVRRVDQAAEQLRQEGRLIEGSDGHGREARQQ